jgi:transposase
MTNILNLPSFAVLEIKEDGRAYDITVESTIPVTACQACQSPNIIGHGVFQQLFMDAPHHGLRTGVTVVRKRFRCKSCGKTFMESLPDMDDKRLATKRLVDWVKKRSLDRTFASVAEDSGLDEKTVRNIFRDYVNELEATFQIETPRWLGIDEVHLSRKMRCVITNIEQRTIVEMLSDRTKPVVARALSKLPNQKRVEYVTMDMWRPYKDAAYSVFPHAKVIVDKFHVVRMATDGVDEARKATKEGLTAAQRRKMKGDRFVLLKRPSDLTLSQDIILSGILNNYPLIAEAYYAKEAFYSIWEANDRKKAEDLYESWESGLSKDVQPYFSDLTKAMGNWHNEVFNYFDHPITNAYTECLNGIIKIMNRLGRGYSFDALRAKILFSEEAHKKMNRPHRAMRSVVGIQSDIDAGLMTPHDLFMDFGAHIPTLLKILDEAV